MVTSPATSATRRLEHGLGFRPPQPLCCTTWFDSGYCDHSWDHQEPSGAIKGLLGPSRELEGPSGGHQRAVRGFQWPFEGHQGPAGSSGSIRGHQVPSRDFWSHQGPSAAFWGPSRDLVRPSGGHQGKRLEDKQSYSSTTSLLYSVYCRLRLNPSRSLVRNPVAGTTTEIMFSHWSKCKYKMKQPQH